MTTEMTKLVVVVHPSPSTTSPLSDTRSRNIGLFQPNPSLLAMPAPQPIAEESLAYPHLVDTVIVGAGVAGLTAAYRLMQAQGAPPRSSDGTKVLLLEASSRVGGRLMTHHISETQYVDMGGAWVGHCQPHITRLLKELDLQTFQQYDHGAVVIDTQANLCSSPAKSTPQPTSPSSSWKASTSKHAPPPASASGPVPWTLRELVRDHGVLAGFELFLYLRRLRKHMAEMDLYHPEKHPRAHYYDQRTVGELTRRWMFTKGARQFIDAIVRELPCVEPWDISYWGFVWNIKTAGTLEQMLAIKNGAQELRIVGGAQGICHALCQRLQPFAPAVQGWFQSTVTAIERNDYHTSHPVTIRIQGGTTVQCKRVILACPPTAYRRIHFQPTLPVFHQTLANSMMMGSVSKISVVYERPFWREMGWSGEVRRSMDTPLTNLSDSNYTEETHPNPIYSVIDGSTPGTYLLKVFITAASNIAFSELSEDFQRKVILRELVRYFGEEAGHPTHFLVANWAEDPFAMGAFGNVMATGWISRSSNGKSSIEVLKNIQWDGRLHFAGTETSVEWNGYMDGAVASGERVAKEVISDP